MRQRVGGRSDLRAGYLAAGAWVVASLFAAGCGGKVDFVASSGSGSSTSGSTTTSSTGAGVGGATSHAIDIEVEQKVPAQNGDKALVLWNHEDGSLVQSWLASELPVNVVATDGDIVTYAYVSGGIAPDGEVRSVVSFRVTPQVQKIRHHAESFFAQPTLACAEKTMTAHVHVPDVPGALSVHVSASPGSGYAVELETPKVVDVPITSCGDSVALLTIARGNQDSVLAFQLDQDIPLVDGSEVDVTFAGKNEPRTPLTVDVDDLDGVTKGFAFARWDGSYTGYPLFFTSEYTLDQAIDGPAPFVFSTNQVDLPLGVQLAYVDLSEPATATSCGGGASFRRYGRSDVPLSFHAHALAQPIIDGASWTLGPGIVGDEVSRTFALGPLYTWQLHEDPTAPPGDAVYPVFPTVVPDVLKDMPSTPPVFSSAAHVDVEEVAGYAALVSASGSFYPSSPTSGSSFPLTTRVRFAGVCP